MNYKKINVEGAEILLFNAYEDIYSFPLHPVSPHIISTTRLETKFFAGFADSRKYRSEIIFNIRKIHDLGLRANSFFKVRLNTKVVSRVGRNEQYVMTFNNERHSFYLETSTGDNLSIDITSYFMNAINSRATQFEIDFSIDKFTNTANQCVLQSPIIEIYYYDYKLNSQVTCTKNAITPKLNFDIEGASVGEIDLANKNVKTAQTLISKELSLMPIDIASFYDSNRNEDVGLGHGFKLNINQKLYHKGRRQQQESQEEYEKRYSPEITPIEYFDEFGTKKVFRETFYYMENGIKYYVSKNQLRNKNNGQPYVDVNSNYRIIINGKELTAYLEMADDDGNILHVNYQRQDALSALMPREEKSFVFEGNEVVDIFIKDGKYYFKAFYCEIPLQSKPQQYFKFRMRYQYVKEENGKYIYDNGRDRFEATLEDTEITKFENSNKTVFLMQFETGYWCDCSADYRERSFTINTNQIVNLDTVTTEAAELREQIAYYESKQREAEAELQEYKSIRDEEESSRLKKLTDKYNSLYKKNLDLRTQDAEKKYNETQKTLDSEMKEFVSKSQSELNRLENDPIRDIVLDIVKYMPPIGQRVERSIRNSINREITDLKNNIDTKKAEFERVKSNLGTERQIQLQDIELANLQIAINEQDALVQKEKLNDYIASIESQINEISSLLAESRIKLYELIDYEKTMPLDYMDKGGIKYWFDYYGRLAMIMTDDEHYHIVEYDNNNHISTIKDKDGKNVINFVFDKGNHLTSIIDFKNRTTTFSYKNGFLEMITKPSRNMTLGKKDNKNAMPSELYKYSADMQFASEQDIVATNQNNIYFEYDNGILKEIVNSWGYAKEFVLGGNILTLTEKTYATQIDKNYIFDYMAKTNAEIKQSLQVEYLKNRTIIRKSNNDIQTLFLNSDGSLCYSVDGECDISKKDLKKLNFTYEGTECSYTVFKEKELKNYIANGDFTKGFDGWVVDYRHANIISRDGEQLLKIDGDPRLELKATYSIDANMIADTQGLVLSAYASATSAHVNFNRSYQAKPLSFYEEILPSRYTLHAEVYYLGYQETEKFSASFDCFSTDRQLLCLAVPIDNSRSLSKIDIILDYSHNINQVFFSDIKLTNGEFSFYKQTARNSTSVVLAADKSSRTISHAFILNNPTFIEKVDVLGEKTYEKFGYNGYGKIVMHEDSKGIIQEYEYDEKGLLKKESKYHKDEPAVKHINETKADELGREIESSSELYGKEIANKTVYQNDSDMVQSTTSPTGVRTTYGYDFATGALLNVTSDVDGEENSSVYSYNYDYITSLKSSNGMEVEYTYDKFGRSKDVKLNSTWRWIKSYDDNAVVENQSLVRVSTKFNTAESDEFVTDTDKKTGNVKTVSHKKTGKVLEKIKEYTYDELGSKTLRKDDYKANTKQTYEYGENNGKSFVTKNILTKANVEIIKQELEYDKKDRVKTIFTTLFGRKYQSNVEYDSDEIKSLTLPNGHKLKINKDKMGRAYGYGIENGENELLSNKLSYVKSGQHSTQMVASSQYYVNGLTDLKIKYLYDDSGNITHIYENNRLVLCYLYDKLGRLIREDNTLLNESIKYNYDNNGNLTDIEKGVFTLETEFATTTRKLFYYGKTNPDRLLKVDGEGEFEYDLIGNPTKYKGKTLKWEMGRELTRYDTIDFTYNADGIRTSKTKNGKTIEYLVMDSTLCGENRGDSQLVYLGDGVGFEYITPTDSSVYYYRKNVQGDVIALLTNDGSIAARYVYNAWGKHKVLNPDGSENTNESFIGNINPVRYRGYYFDTETGLYYLKSRYYDPELCRFINADDVAYLAPQSINGLNLYAYCANNPVTYKDSTGRKPEVNAGVDFGSIFNKSGSLWNSGRYKPNYRGLKTDLQNPFKYFGHNFKASMHNFGQVFLASLEGRALNWNLTVGVLADKGITAFAVGGSLFDGRMHINSTDYFGVTVGSASIALFDVSFGENFKLIIIEAQATALAVGMYSQYVDAEVLLGSVGGVLKFENGALTVGFSLGWGIKFTIRFW